MSGRRLSRRASQERVAALEAEVAQLRAECGRLTVTSRLLARELSNTESELPAAKSPGVGRRRSTRRSSSSSRGRDGRPSSRAASDAYVSADEGSQHGGSKAFAEQLAGAPAHLMEGSVGKTSTTSSNTGSSSTAVTPEASRGKAGAPASDGPTGGIGGPLAPGSLVGFPEATTAAVAAAAAGASGLDGPSAAADAVFRAAPPLEHAWCPCPGAAFNVRVGPNYARTGAKMPSLAALYDAWALDAFLLPDLKEGDLGSRMRLPPDDTIAPFGVPANLVVTCLVPDYSPSFFEQRKDGRGWALVMCCRISPAARAQLRSGELSPALRLWREFVGAEPGANVRKRLKCICGVANPNELQVDTMSRSLVTKYNAKPFICKTSGVFYKRDHYFGVEVDAHRWGKLALNGFALLKGYIPEMRVRLGLLIEGVDDDELPEQILACAYLSHLSAQKCQLTPENRGKAPAPADDYDDPMAC